jgi:hypothetical protein
MLQADLDNLQSWSDTWLLKFHPNKCKVMSVANKSVDKGTKHYLFSISPTLNGDQTASVYSI